MDVITDGVIVPGICGPLGLLPVRLRVRAMCAARGLDTPELMSGGPVSIDLNAPSGYRVSK